MPEEKGENHPIRAYRRVGNNCDWEIAFDSSREQWPSISDFVFKHAGFDILVDKHNPPELDMASAAMHCSLKSKSFHTYALRYRYICGNWMAFLGRRTEKLTRLELQRLPPEARSNGYKSCLYGIGIHTTRKFRSLSHGLTAILKSLTGTLLRKEKVHVTGQEINLGSGGDEEDYETLALHVA